MSFINELLDFVQLIEKGLEAKSGHEFIAIIEAKANSLSKLDDFEISAQKGIDELVALCKNAFDPDSPTTLTVEVVGAIGKLLVGRWSETVGSDTQEIISNIQTRLGTLFDLVEKHLDDNSPVILQPTDIGSLIRGMFTDISWKSAGDEFGAAAELVVNAWNEIEDFMSSNFDKLHNAISYAASLLGIECNIAIGDAIKAPAAAPEASDVIDTSDAALPEVPAMDDIAPASAEGASSSEDVSQPIANTDMPEDAIEVEIPAPDASKDEL